MYDYLIVGSGLYGAVCAHELKKKGARVLVIEKRPHVGGNIYTERVEGITVHKYGAHIFHTSDREVWEYVNEFASFNNFINSPIARFHNECYNMPFNMNTFTKLWPDVFTPAEAKARIEEEKRAYGVENSQNLEEQAINLVGKTIYEKLVKGYTEKQWGRKCNALPAFIIKRLPVRFTFDNNYFSDRYQGIPEGGYTQMITRLLEGVEVRLNCDFFENREGYFKEAKKVIYTGPIDRFFDFKFGELEYRTLRFETQVLNIDNFQGNAVVNYTDAETPFTRIIEHKHFEFAKGDKTVVTREYPCAFTPGAEPYYPINDEKNNALYQKYRAEGERQQNVVFGGRLGLYQYFDMDDCIRAALDFVRG